MRRGLINRASFACFSLQPDSKFNPDLKTEDAAKVAEFIIKSLQEGKREDLVQAGFTITEKSLEEELEEKFQDEQLNEKILGPVSDEELEISQLIESMRVSGPSELLTHDEFEANGFDGGAGDTIRDILSEATDSLQHVRTLREQGTLNTIDWLEKSETDGQDSQEEEAESARIHPPVGFASVLGDKYAADSVAPPVVSVGAVSEVEELPEEDEEEEVEEEEIVEEFAAMSQEAADVSSIDSFLPKPSEIGSDSFLNAIEETAGTVISPLKDETAATDKSLETTFTALLKATIEESEKKAEALVEEEAGIDLVTNTVTAVTTEDFASLDMKGILGEALYTLTASLGIDVKDELLQSDDSKRELQAIMQANMKELSTNMKQLDEESAQLFEKLGNLRAELEVESAQFEERKQDEFDELLTKQSQMKSEFSASQVYLKESTDKLQKIMFDITENADILTTFALFPIKSIDQKLAFVVGLALLFKVPYDALHLFQLRESDPSVLVSLGLQTAVGVACFNHFGLIRAIRNTLAKKS